MRKVTGLAWLGGNMLGIYFLRSFHFTIEALSKLIGELGSLVYNWSSLPNMWYLK